MITVQLTCQTCESSFPFDIQSYAALGLVGKEGANLPKRCPKCNDIRQQRPVIALERTCLLDFPVFFGKSVAQVLRRAQPFTSGHWKDAHVNGGMRYVLTGKDLGSSWSGRIDIWCMIPYDQIQPGAMAHFRLMEVLHSVWVQDWQRNTRTGIVAGTERIVTPTIPQGLEDSTEPSEFVFDETTRRMISQPYKIEEATQYVAIYPFDAASMDHPEHQLVCATARSKTTLKGYGRQYSARITGQDKAAWCYEVGGGVRNHRAYTTKVFAVMPVDCHLSIIHTEDGNTEEFPVD